ncbi:MAG: tetratricopeptide repeat protein [Bacteroidales bacterium]|jgi:TolA-binding protein|nr:tetratricopeptide repeat protein [Bacteroidales bacterium]
MKKITKCLLFGMFVLMGVSAIGQQTMSKKNPGEKYRMGVELFNLEKFASANELMLSVVAETRKTDPMMAMNAAFYAAVSSARLSHRDAVKNLQQFILNYPESTRVPEVRLELANVLYVEKEYERAIQVYDQIDVRDLSEKQQIEYHFKKGYSYFMRNQLSKAKPHFAEIRNVESRYTPLATYFYAYILYAEGNFQSALLEFEKLQNDETFGSIVPFYMMQIFYRQGKNDLIIAQGPALLKTATPRRAVEISRLIGEAFYNENRYAEALPFLQLYFEKSAITPTREDDYILGFTYYHLQKYDSAAFFFQRVVNASTEIDLMKQNALYHLGDIYIKLGQRQFAQAAFLDASKIDIDERIQEDAFYNYAKLSYQLSPSPYNEALRAMQAYLEKYPDSRYADEIYGYLIAMYTTTKNYRDAYAAIANVKRKDPRLLEAAQRIAFNRGVELFNEMKFTEAQKMFNEAIQSSYDERLTLLAFYWKGETYYRMGRFADALENYERTLFSSLFETFSEFPLAAYGAGYANFQMRNYPQAAKYFAMVIQHKNQLNQVILNDAYLRLGDAFFMQRRLNEALQNYELAIQLNQTDRDYAMLQKAISLRILGRYDAAITTLLSILKDYENSPLIPKAINELASTYLILDNNTKALEYYRLLSTNHGRSSFGKMALLKQGLIYYNIGKNNEAIAMFEKVIAEHPGTTEAKEALMSLRNIYVAINRTDDFFAYVKRIGTNINEDTQDSIAFSAAENRYLENDCHGAKPSLEGYLQRFPNGIFITEVTYYLADCEMRSGNVQQARKHFLTVISLPISNFTERSIISAAKISFDLQDFQQALKLYTMLSEFSENTANINMAIIAIMRCEMRLGNDERILAAAQNVLKLDKLTDDIRDEANHAIATSAQRLGQNLLAREAFAKLRNSKNSEFAAQARYFEIEELFANKEYELAEKKIFEFISETPSSDYFLAKTYLLWGSIYAERGNFLQARQTFQSIIDNYDNENDDIIETAKRRLQNVLDKEAQLRDEEDRRRAEDAGEEDFIMLPDDF